MKWLQVLLWLAALAAVLAGCGRASGMPSMAAKDLAVAAPTSDAASMGEARMMEVATPSEAGSMGEAPMMEVATPSDAPAAAALVETARIIRTASVALEVERIPDAEQRVRDLIESAGGYISDSRISYAEGYGAGGTLTARVPADRYADTYASLCAGGYGYLITASEQTQDVTEEWVDTESRIRVLEGERDKLRELLMLRGELAEILEVQREILNVQMQIEQAQGRLNVLKNRVSLSTITIELRLRADESELAQSQRERDKWRPGYVFKRSLAGMVRGLQGVANGIIVAATYIPCWGPVGLALWLLWRRLRRLSDERTQRRAAAEERRLQAWEEYRRASEGTSAAEPSPEPGADAE